MIWTGERVVPTDMFNLIITLQEHIARYNSTLRRIKSNDVIIDLGCGTGYGTHLLSMVTHNLVYGIDISKEAIDYAKHYYSRDNIKYLNMDIEKLDFDVLADVIISFEVIEHINPDLFFESVKNHLKPDGTLIFSTPIVQVAVEKPENSFHLFEWTLEQLMQQITSRFKHLELFEQYNELNFRVLNNPTNYFYCMVIAKGIKY